MNNIKIKKTKSNYYKALTVSQTKILESLAIYKFLTSSQMVTLEVMTHEKNINTQIRFLRGLPKPLMDSENFGSIPKIGRLESIHFLTKKGKQLLIEELGYSPEDIRLPTNNNSLFYQDYFHRKYTIDCHIRASNWAKESGIEVLFFDRYFDKVGNNRIDKNMRAKTKINLKNKQYLIADGVLMILLPDGAQELYCLEMYDGKDTLRTLKQLKKHVEAIEIGSVSEQYGLPYAHRVLCVFEHEGLQKAVIKRANQESEFTNVKEFFLTKTLQSVLEQPFDKGWVNLLGEEVGVY
ncbi:hypothetical protein [Microscilla marina]|nr:hypothetical protein [Microscilla marina]